MLGSVQHHYEHSRIAASPRRCAQRALGNVGVARGCEERRKDLWPPQPRMMPLLPTPLLDSTPYARCTPLDNQTDVCVSRLTLVSSTADIVRCCGKEGGWQRGLLTRRGVGTIARVDGQSCREVLRAS